jgi:nitrogen regulatory protein PII
METLESAISNTKGMYRARMIGDGKVFIYPIRQVIRIRTEETAAGAL